MNAELLSLCPPEVRAEWYRMLALNGALERGLELCVRDYVNGREPEGLPGSPPPTTEEARAWMDYYIGRGFLVYQEEIDLRAVPA